MCYDSLELWLEYLNFFRCFDRFFKAVNSKEGKLVLKRRVHLMDDDDLIGVDYVWRVSVFSRYRWVDICVSGGCGLFAYLI